MFFFLEGSSLEDALFRILPLPSEQKITLFASPLISAKISLSTTLLHFFWNSTVGLV